MQPSQHEPAPPHASVVIARTARRSPRLTIDFSKPAHRRMVLGALVGLSLLTTGFLVGGYKVYEYTESSEFCGTVCHVMDSQFERFQVSQHANVPCAECHIGPGASFFVKSKIDGIRQVYAVVAHTYSRPIKSPVEDLRPARETCETCHTPTAYQDNIVKSITHYENDRENTPVRSTLILKMGGWKELSGVASGIHWHINSQVYYIAADRQRQVMAWVGVEQPDGSLKGYYARNRLYLVNTSFVENARSSGEMRLLDCIDCHNRAAHLIPPPENAVDQAIADGLISRQVPFIRAKAVDVLTTSYPSRADAALAIDALENFYETNFPAVYRDLADLVRSSLAQIKQIYDQTNYPAMNLNWETNPNNETHTPDLGCFRCHDGEHIALDEAGNTSAVISVKCNLCHSVPIVGRGDDLLVEAPVIVGEVPDTHTDFRWTIEHRHVPEPERQACFNCHGTGFCNNAACHNLQHPQDMLYRHAEIFKVTGNQTCYNCHQNITCTGCHPQGVVVNP